MRIANHAVLSLLACAALAAPAAADEIDVSQKNKVFAPGEIQIKVGDTIVFHNDDEITHNIFSRSENAEFNLKMQPPGEDLKYTFDKPGTAMVRCAIHPKMKLVVQVVE
jgi:plastocyanin